MRALKFIGYVIYNSAYTYKFQLKTTEVVAGGYGVKNIAKTREFLHKWANLEYGQPKARTN